MKRQVVPTTTPEQREESFRRWLERKRTQNEQRKAEVIMQKFRNSERQEQERQKRYQDKNEKLAVWIRKKEEEMKCMRFHFNFYFLCIFCWYLLGKI